MFLFIWVGCLVATVALDTGYKAKCMTIQPRLPDLAAGRAHRLLPGQPRPAAAASGLRYTLRPATDVVGPRAAASGAEGRAAAATPPTQRAVIAQNEALQRPGATIDRVVFWQGHLCSKEAQRCRFGQCSEWCCARSARSSWQWTCGHGRLRCNAATSKANKTCIAIAYE